MQSRQTEVNKKAWNTMAYQAWLHGLGSPEELAEKLRSDPHKPLRRWMKFIGNPRGKRIINLLGSHGGKAIPLAILGSDITVIDISEENKTYAMEVAKYAGVEISYINSDVLSIVDQEKLGEFDMVLMEFGVLHYFSDLNLLFGIVSSLLKDNGRFILTDFHPTAAKLLEETENGIVLSETANYFQTGFIEAPIAYTHFLPESERSLLRNVLLRKWTIGEIITNLCSNDFVIRAMEEEPNGADKRFPAFYTLISDKTNLMLMPLQPT
jgi:2-polyprenyl-3-methyl-5-hydroxy-6-metoxy-1,4-benzoquinol methylase